MEIRIILEMIVMALTIWAMGMARRMPTKLIMLQALLTESDCAHFGAVCGGGVDELMMNAMPIKQNETEVDNVNAY